ncbi:cell division protein FtsB [Parahaliea aestuarii]|uniref:Cell division protein FtsB n=1 Tax=Parahaliea aestuarii TaxID=1852021 RepID=A0A5C9A0I8_9GAMM|nr:cell division protein FtsB [Parahaliea aestuarii]TXS93504.1 cell division protein FtsB [Parahaliea aestuarii]
MRWLLAVLVFLLLVLQYRLWIAEGSLAEKHRLESQVVEQSAINEELRARNAVLEREVLELQSGNRSVEQRAREQLGLIREGEVFYQFVEEDEAPRKLPAAGGSDQPEGEAAGERQSGADNRAPGETATGSDVEGEDRASSPDGEEQATAGQQPSPPAGAPGA